MVEPREKSFLVAVQWHPERMDSLSQLSMPVAGDLLKKFIGIKQKIKRNLFLRFLENNSKEIILLVQTKSNFQKICIQ